MLRMAAPLLPVALLSSGCAAAVDDAAPSSTSVPAAAAEAARLYARIRVQAAAAGLPGPLGYNTALAGDSLDSGDRPLPSLEAAGAARAVPDEATVSRAVAAVGFDLVSYAWPAADGAVALEVRAPDGSPAEVIARWPEAFTAALGDGDGTWLLRLEEPDGDWVKVLWQEPLTTVRGGVTRPGLVDPGVVA